MGSSLSREQAFSLLVSQSRWYVPPSSRAFAAMSRSGQLEDLGLLERADVAVMSAGEAQGAATELWGEYADLGREALWVDRVAALAAKPLVAALNDRFVAVADAVEEVRAATALWLAGAPSHTPRSGLAALVHAHLLQGVAKVHAAGVDVLVEAMFASRVPVLCQLRRRALADPAMVLMCEGMAPREALLAAALLQPA